jgi:uncharacterized protein YraI
MANRVIKTPLGRVLTLLGLGLTLFLTTNSTISAPLQTAIPGVADESAAAPIAFFRASPATSAATRATSPPSPQADIAAYRIVSRWDINPVTYSIVNCPAAVDCDAAHAAAQQAIEAWDEVSGLSLEPVPQDGDIVLLWASGYHGDGFPFDGPGGILGHTFYPLEYLGAWAGDVHLDMDEQWTLDAPNDDQTHLPTTVMHEVGHALGLGHSRDPEALMWAEYDGIRTLAADDIAGIQALYGPPEPEPEPEPEPSPTPPPESPEPPSPVTATATTTVRIRSGPDVSFEQIGLLPLDAEVPVTGKNTDGSWLFIEYEGAQGWAAGWLMLINGDLDGVPILDMPQEDAVPTAASGSNVHIRSGPGTEYELLGSLPANESVPIVGRSEAVPWLLVEYQGTQGWIAEWLVAVEGDLSLVPVR